MITVSLLALAGVAVAAPVPCWQFWADDLEDGCRARGCIWDSTQLDPLNWCTMPGSVPMAPITKVLVVQGARSSESS